MNWNDFFGQDGSSGESYIFQLILDPTEHQSLHKSNEYCHIVQLNSPTNPSQYIRGPN